MQSARTAPPRTRPGRPLISVFSSAWTVLVRFSAVLHSDAPSPLHLFERQETHALLINIPAAFYRWAQSPRPADHQNQVRQDRQLAASVDWDNGQYRQSSGQLLLGVQHAPVSQVPHNDIHLRGEKKFHLRKIHQKKIYQLQDAESDSVLPTKWKGLWKYPNVTFSGASAALTRLCFSPSSSLCPGKGKGAVKYRQILHDMRSGGFTGQPTLDWRTRSSY